MTIKGIGQQNFSIPNMQQAPDGTVTYKAVQGDSMDGDIATILALYGKDETKNQAAPQYSPAINFDSLNQNQQAEVLLKYAHQQSQQVAQDSGIKDTNSIHQDEKLNLKSLNINFVDGTYLAEEDSKGKPINAFQAAANPGNHKAINPPPIVNSLRGGGDEFIQKDSKP